MTAGLPGRLNTRTWFRNVSVRGVGQVSQDRKMSKDAHGPA